MASTIWKGYLTFGLLSLPVKLYSAARSETVSFNQLHKHDNSRVKQVIYCQAEDKPIQRSEIVKGYEYEKDKYVVIDDEDIKKVAPKTAKTMEILIPFAVLVVWIILQVWVLPRFGVKT